MAEAKNSAENRFPAYGPEKEAWKAEGNYFTASDLERMAKELEGMKLADAPDQVYDAN